MSTLFLIPTPLGEQDVAHWMLPAQAGRLRPEQALFLERIRCAGGVAFVARDCRDVLRTLGEAQAP